MSSSLGFEKKTWQCKHLGTLILCKSLIFFPIFSAIKSLIWSFSSTSWLDRMLLPTTSPVSKVHTMSSFGWYFQCIDLCFHHHFLFGGINCGSSSLVELSRLFISLSYISFNSSKENSGSSRFSICSILEISFLSFKSSIFWSLNCVWIYHC